MISHAPNTSMTTPVPGQGRLRATSDLVAFTLLTLAVAGLFFTAPKSGDFWWSDAPRHAMDGAFYRDVVRDLPVDDIKQYAMDYYIQYPALTLLFYPPMYPVVESVVFAIFGVSHFSAQLTIALFYLVSALGAYKVCRYWLSPIWSFSASLLFISFPEVALWGRQVMLEIPAFAFLVWAFWAVLRYNIDLRPRYLYLASALMIGGVYTKQTVAFALPVLAAAIVFRYGWSALKNKHAVASGVLFLVGILPLAVVTYRFGRINVNSVTGGNWTQIPVFSIQGWLFYLQQLPAQTGWIPLILGAGLAAWFLLRGWRTDVNLRLMLLWFAVGYVFFSLIALKEPRHTTIILFPLAVFAVEALRRIPSRIGAAAAVSLATAVLTATLATSTPAVGGYREAANYVATHAPKDSVVLFSGYRDGSFVFNMREREDRKDLAVLRNDKLLLRVPQRRELGVVDYGLSESQILRLFEQYGVSYIVNQPNFWDDLKSMQQFQRILQLPQFRKVAVIRVTSNVDHLDHELEIYQNLGPIVAGKKKISLEIPMADLPVQGTIGRLR